MLVTDYKEEDDGSATLQVDLSKEESAILIEYALKSLLTKAAAEYDARSDSAS